MNRRTQIVYIGETANGRPCRRIGQKRKQRTAGADTKSDHIAKNLFTQDGASRTSPPTDGRMTFPLPTHQRSNVPPFVALPQRIFDSKAHRSGQGAGDLSVVKPHQRSNAAIGNLSKAKKDKGYHAFHMISPIFDRWL